MITSSYGVDSVEDAFNFALKTNLNFKGIVNAKVCEQYSKYEGCGHYDYQYPSQKECSKCEGYRYYDYRCPSKSRHVNIVPSDDVDISKVVKNIHVHFEISSVLEDTSIDPYPPILNEIPMSFDSTIDIVDAIVDLVHPQMM